MFNILVLATTNKGKLKEFRELLKDFPVEIRSLADFGPIPAVVEDGETFDDNAYKKAHFTAKVLGLPCIADDSGLAVEALNGAPGCIRPAMPERMPAMRRTQPSCLKIWKALPTARLRFIVSFPSPCLPARP
jgi:non-canonical purine NTP pyrophosphatase (RdgB/HAM1 family)